MINETILTYELMEKANIIYDFVDLFTQYENTVRDYGGDNFLTMNEVHMLTYIERNPGITASDVARNFRRSRGFISQCITKLDSNWYITRVPQENDAKKKSIFVTQKGKDLCMLHSQFDEKNLAKTYNYLRRDCTHNEIEAFYKVMDVYNRIMVASARKRRERPKICVNCQTDDK